MNINPEKIDQVIIRDAEGKVIHQFQLGMIGTWTTIDKKKQLIIQQAKP